MKKQRSITGYMFTVNCVQILSCFVIYLLSFTPLTFSYTIYGLLFGIQGIIWFVFGVLAALGTDMLKPKYALNYSFLSVFPITLLFIICLLIGSLTPEATYSWAQFFFLGAPLSFFLKPAVFLSLFIKDSAYLVYGIDIILIMLASFFGCLTGMEANKKKQRNNRG